MLSNNGGIFSGYQSLLTIYLSGTPSQETGTRTPSCLYLSNGLYFPMFNQKVSKLSLFCLSDAKKLFFFLQKVLSLSKNELSFNWNISSYTSFFFFFFSFFFFLLNKKHASHEVQCKVNRHYLLIYLGAKKVDKDVQILKRMQIITYLCEKH